MSQTSQNPTVSVQTLANLFGLTDERIRQLAKDGVVIKATRGQYELWPSIRNYVRYLQTRKVNQHEHSDDPDASRERALLLREQREMVALRRREHEGELLRADEVIREWTNHIARCRAHLLSLPNRLADQCQHHDYGTIRARAEDIIHEALTNLADNSEESESS